MSDYSPVRVHTGSLIRRAQQRHVALWARHVSTETSSVQFSLLAALALRGEASQRELCEDVDLDRSTIADLVRRIERRGLLSRRRSDADARRNVVVLTELGRQELHLLRPRVDALDTVLTAQLADSERTALHTLLNRILAADAVEPAVGADATASASATSAVQDRVAS